MERNSRSVLGITLALALTLVCGFVRPANASVVYVNANATSPTPDGKTWATAFTAIRPALYSAIAGDDIWVADSMPATSSYSDISIPLTPGVPVYGGFAGTETARDQRDWKSHPTVVNAKVLLGAAATGLDFTLDGLNFIGPGSGNLLVDNYHKLTVSNCTFDPQQKQIFSGELSVSTGTLVVTNTTITGATFYGVSVGKGGFATVTNCLLVGSFGGVTLQGGSANVLNSTITGNSASGVYVNSGAVSVMNCTLTGNASAGVSLSSGVAHITNSIVAYNRTGVDGAANGIFVTLSHNDIYGNDFANVTDIADPTGIDGNISKDPKLASIYHDMHIQPDSPCVDAGDDSVVQSNWTDIDGQPRIIGAHVDIGSDESTGIRIPAYVPTIYHVSPTGADSNDGLTWLTAKRTVTGGLSAAMGSGEVWVAAGSYVENVTFPYGVELYGGFAGTETSRDQRDLSRNVSRLDGPGGQRVTMVEQGAILDGFAIHSGMPGVHTWAAAKIANCTFIDCSTAIDSGGAETIIGCTINRTGGYGIRVTGKPSIINCTVANCSSDGIWVKGASVSVDGCAITGNANEGINNESGVLRITNSTLSGNASNGIRTLSGTSNITDCTFIGNSVGGIYQADGVADVNRCSIMRTGLGIRDGSGNAVITNCILTGNASGGVRIEHAGNLSLANSTISGSPDGIMIDGAATVTNCTLAGNVVAIDMQSGTLGIDNCISAFNAAGIERYDGVVGISHSNVYGNTSANFLWLTDPTGTNGNISADPLFFNRLTGDYHLRLRSPCIDTGDDSVVTPGETDLDGRPRIQRSHVDMGCYEFPGVVKYVPTPAPVGFGS